MTTSDKPRVPITGIQQVCIVVKNLQKTMEDYWNILGIGPWAIFTFEPPAATGLRCNGKPAWGRYRGAVAQVGPVELELIETIEGTSIYQDWIDEHGEGLHHMKFMVEDLDVDRVTKTMEGLGFPSIMSGHHGPEGKWHFSYFNTRKALHAIWETGNRTGGTPDGLVLYPEDPKAISPAKVKVSHIRQVAICVKDVVRSAENYWNIFGVGPWRIYDWGSHVIRQRFYHGKPAWGREIVAFAEVGDFQLELMQPVEGDSLYQDWLEEQGEGMHHLKFLVDDVEGVSEALTGQGFVSLQSGYYGDVGEKAGGYDYIYIPPLHCIWEPVQEPKSMPVEPFTSVPHE